jgi:NAD(P)-dependent dehydrogenase (short-subunit alcohol dehydrogenase family)
VEEREDMTKGLFDLTGKVAAVTGSGRGLGRTIAIGLASYGANVVVCSRTQAQVEKVAGEIQALGKKALALTVDTSRKADVDRMVEAAVKTFGRIDVLVNNAGIDIMKPAVDYTEDEWDQVLAINLKGYFLCAQAAGRVMIEQTSGSILMNSSIAGVVGMATLAPYSASKGGIHQLVKTLAIEWAPYNVRVNAFAPGYFENIMEGGTSANAERVRTWTPMARRGRPEELIGPTVFLASEASSFVTGAILSVDGGWTII